MTAIWGMRLDRHHGMPISVRDEMERKLLPRILDKEDCQFEGLNLRISDSALVHMRTFHIDSLTLCDMLSSPIDCPKKKRTGKAFRKSSRRICSHRNNVIYNIILDEYLLKGEKLWSVSHLEPI